jgi:hypothetical protein
VCRAGEAGVRAARLPDALGRPTARLLARLGLCTERRGEAA